MKTAKTILREMIDIEDPLDEKVVIAAMKYYAKEVAKEALKNAAENGKAETVGDSPSVWYCSCKPQVDKKSIISETNIPEL